MNTHFSTAYLLFIFFITPVNCREMNFINIFYGQYFFSPFSDMISNPEIDIFFL